MDTFAPATALAGRIRVGDLSPVDLVEACLERIAARNERTNAFVTVREEAARREAREAEQSVGAGEELGALHGLPVAVKDLTDTAGTRTTYGSVPLADYVPERDDPVVARLRDAGAIVLGKTNTSEFGHVATTHNQLFGATGTPFDPSKTAGGSSGGSAAAVADGLAALGQGTDAGGSVRIPASACGVYGFKPTFGRVPRGTRPDAFLDTLPFWHTGSLTRTVGDAALMLDATAGQHPRDPFSVPAGVPDEVPTEAHDEAHGKPHDEENRGYRGALDRSVEGLRAAYSPDLGVFPVDGRVRDVVGDAVDAFRDAGMTVERADPDLDDVWDDARDAALTIFQARTAAVAATSEEAFGVDLREHREALSPVFAAMVERGNDHSAVDLSRANAARTRAFDRLQDCFAAYDLLVTPTLAVPPFAVNRYGPEEIEGEPVDRYTGWYLTQPFNWSGHPAASLPAGTVDGLPVGLQLAGRRHADATVLAASAAFERERPWDDCYPPGETNHGLAD